MDKWQKQYIKNKQWLENSYLVIPVKVDFGYTAIKKCACCQHIKYTVEFANSELFDDKKLPVCTKCIYKRKSSKAKKILNKTGFTQECLKCKQSKSIAEFKVNRSQVGENELHTVCVKCMSKNLNSVYY